MKKFSKLNKKIHLRGKKKILMSTLKLFITTNRDLYSKKNLDFHVFRFTSRAVNCEVNLFLDFLLVFVVASGR